MLLAHCAIAHKFEEDFSDHDDAGVFKSSWPSIKVLVANRQPKSRIASLGNSTCGEPPAAPIASSGNIQHLS